MTDKKPYIIKRDENNVKVASRNDTYWKEMNQKKYELLLQKSEIPPFYWKIDFKDYKGVLSADNVEKVKKYAEKCFDPKFDYVNLYLWSEGNSSQKTAQMCNIGKEIIRQNKKVKFILAGDLADKLLKNQGFNYRDEIVNYFENLKQQDMLLIDDAFDSKKSIVWERSDLIISEWDRFLRNLFSSKIKVVMTSNISPENISKKFGKSIYELIDRNCMALEFKDSIKYHRKKMFENIFDD